MSTTSPGTARSVGPPAASAGSVPSRALWRKRVVTAAVSWVVLSALALVLQMDPALIVLGALVVSAFATMWLLGDLSPEAQAPYWHGDYHPLPRERGFDPRLAQLRRAVHDTFDRRRSGHPQDQLHPLLLDLARERLQAKHGCSLETDPEDARRLLGPALLDYLLAEPPRPPRLRSAQLSEYLTRIESL